jgi:hypothetical protein
MTASIETESNIYEGPAESSSKNASLLRQVSFSDIQDIREIENKASISRKEKNSRWMTAYEHDKIKDDCDREMFRLVTSDYPAMKTELRGLELFDPETISRSRTNNKKAVNAVVRTQLEQRLQGRSNPEDIRHVYMHFVRHSTDDAHANASIDQEVVKDYMSTTIVELQTQSSEKRHGRPSLQSRLMRSLTKRLGRKSEQKQQA